jgi:hypothetical protein
MTSEETRVFKLLDEYSRDRHNCFVSEMFLNESKTAYTLCFRRTDVNRDSPDRYACRYFHLQASEVNTIAEEGTLTASIAEQLDKELPGLR